MSIQRTNIKRNKTMPAINNLNPALCLLAGIVAVIILLGLLVRFCLFVNDFSQELKYLNTEIKRTNGDARRHWIRQRRRLWLSLIPFVKYWFTCNRDCLCGERGNECVLFRFTSRYRGRPIFLMGRQSKGINTVCAFCLPKGNKGELKVWIIRWKKYGISYPQRL